MVYRDPTPLDPERDYTAEELAKFILEKMYGEHTREAMARSLLKANEVAEWAREVAQQLIDGSFDEGALNTAIEQKLNDLEQEYAPQLTNIKNEVEDARGNETSLVDRLNSSDSRLAHTNTLIEQIYINVLEHGLSNNGVDDNSDLLEDLILAHKNAVFFFPSGVYYFSKPVNGVKNVYYDFFGEETTNASYSTARGVIETIYLIGQSKENTIFTTDGDYPIFYPKAEQPLKPLNYFIEGIRFVGSDKQNTPFEFNNGEINIIYLRVDSCDFNNWKIGYKYDFRGVPGASNFNTMAYFNECDFGGNLYGAYVTGDNSTLNECFIRNNDIGGLTVGGAQINIRGGKVEYNGRNNGIYKPFQISILSNANSINFDGVYIEPKASNILANNNDDSLIIFEYNSENYEYVTNINFNDCRFNGLRVGVLAEIVDSLYIRGLSFNNCQLFGFKLKYNELIHVSSDNATLKDISINKGTIYDIQNSLGNVINEQDLIMTTHIVVNSEFNTNKTPFLSPEIRNNGINIEKIIGSVSPTGTKYFGTNSYSIIREETGKYLVTLYKQNRGLATGNSDYFPVIVTVRNVEGTNRIATVEMVDNQSFYVHIKSETGNYFNTGFSFEATIVV